MNTKLIFQIHDFVVNYIVNILGFSLYSKFIIKGSLYFTDAVWKSWLLDCIALLNPR